MNKTKSDTQKFLETMWFMSKSSILPWVLGLGLVAFIIMSHDKPKIQRDSKSSKVENIFLQKQR